MSNLVYDLNNDKKVTTADVVYFASALANIPNYDVNFNQQVVSVDGLIQQKVTKKIQESNKNKKINASYTTID